MGAGEGCVLADSIHEKYNLCYNKIEIETQHCFPIFQTHMNCSLSFLCLADRRDSRTDVL